MKTKLTIRAQAAQHKKLAKVLLIKLIIFLTSPSFCIFAGVIANLVCWHGIINAELKTVGYGGVILLAAFVAWAARVTARNMRNPERID